MNREWERCTFNGRYHGHGLKYLMASRLTDGLPVFLSGPYLGTVSDVDILNRSHFEELLAADEVFLGDGGFRGTRFRRGLLPFRGPDVRDYENGDVFNNIQRSVRSVIENGFHLVKLFKIIKFPFHQPMQDGRIYLHQLAFQAATEFVRFWMIQQPILRAEPSPFLFL